MKSVMKHQFSQIPKTEIPRSAFNRSHGYKCSFNAGHLIPFYVDEALPSDTFNVKATIFCRLATPLHPIMDNLFCDVFFFSVPIRIIWSNFRKFMGEQDNPGDTTDYVTPKIATPPAGWLVGSLEDYFGLPTGVDNLEVCSFWHRSYNKIYQDWFKDQNLIDSPVLETGDGPDSPTNYSILSAGKRHDYFTSALPWPQKGNAVQLELGDKAYIVSAAPTGQSYNILDTNLTTRRNLWAGTTDLQPSTTTGGTVANSLYADLSSATASTINELRQAFQLQRLYERDARGGTRYKELVKSHFGCDFPDLPNRPEYLGGTTSPVRFTPVAQTSPTGTYANTPQGNLSAFGTITVNGAGFTKSFVEHACVMGILRVRADQNYQHGIPRMFSRSTRWDFYWPALSHLGEQSILNKEIYAQGTSADDLTFGYQERFAEYRYFPSKICGILRSMAASSLDSWHLAQSLRL